MLGRSEMERKIERLEEQILSLRMSVRSLCDHVAALRQGVTRNDGLLGQWRVGDGYSENYSLAEAVTFLLNHLDVRPVARGLTVKDGDAPEPR